MCCQQPHFCFLFSFFFSFCFVFVSLYGGYLNLSTVNSIYFKLEKKFLFVLSFLVCLGLEFVYGLYTQTAQPKKRTKKKKLVFLLQHTTHKKKGKDLLHVHFYYKSYPLVFKTQTLLAVCQEKRVRKGRKGKKNGGADGRPDHPFSLNALISTILPRKGSIWQDNIGIKDKYFVF